ncbi:MAG: dihydroorotase [Opitutales bacterium]|jgi:dihydroorotase
MSEYLWIRNGRVIDPAAGRDGAGDVFVRDGVFVEDLGDEERAAATVFDAQGLVVCPGLVDIHVHLRDPGQTHKECIKTGSRAAAAGGFTSIVCMPNTTPWADNAGTIQRIKDSVRAQSLVNVFPTGCLTVGGEGTALAPMGSLFRAGVVAVTDDGRCVQNNAIMRRAVEYASMFGLPVMDHCQDYAITDGGVMNEGHWSLRLGLTGWPNAGEDLIVDRNIILSKYTGAHIHMQHLSSAHSVELMRRAKADGINVTAEATPHHIYYTDEALKDYGTLFKMNPPLRTETDRQAIIEGLIDGTIDCIGTDHAPHTSDEKDRELDAAPFGIIGMETALAVCLEVLVHSGRCQLSKLVDLMSRKGAQVLKLNKGTMSAGREADICVFDPDEPWLVKEPFQSRSSNCPWTGTTLRGRVHRTYVKGRLVWDFENPPEPVVE